jgi:aminopeptidase
VQPGDRVLIVMQEPDSLRLGAAVYDEVLRADALPHVQFRSSELDRALLRSGSDEQVSWIPELERAALEWADVCIVLRGYPHPCIADGIPATRIAAHRHALGIISGLRTTLTRWTLCRVPGAAWAREAGLTMNQAIELFWSATLRDWPAARELWSPIRDRLAAGTTVQILGPDTDLTFSTRGRRWVIGDGHFNMPDGEIYTAPRDGSMEGVIAFSWPAALGGQTCAGVRLEFHEGVVTAASATTNEELLQEALATDEGARRPGEIGIGANDGIRRRTGDVLYDEKIAGTLHLALGRAYKECGGVNVSALHWDLITDLHEGGEIRVDGRLVNRNGVWLTRNED